MLRQIMLNLVGNAVKFTDAGSVRIRVACRAEQERLQVSVADTGVGIDAEQLDSLFRPFEQIDNSATRRAGGTGLGLSITKKLVHDLGGEISAASTPGEGSVFNFTLATGPLGAAEWIAADAAAATPSAETLPVDPAPTLSGRDAEEVAWRQMGFAHYLQKPAPFEEIDRILRSG